MSLKKLFPLLLSCFFSLQINVALANDYSDAAALVDKSAIVFDSFTEDPSMGWFQDNLMYAKGVFIVPQMLKAGFFIGGSGGSGVLLSKNMEFKTWSYPVFYTMGAVSLGLQFGGEASEIILMIMTEKGMESMFSTSFKLGADVTVAAGPVGRGAKAATADILAFARSKGAFIGVAVEGSVLKPLDTWNYAYYKNLVTPFDILSKKTVRNPHANTLRKIVREKSKLRTNKVSY